MGEKVKGDLEKRDTRFWIEFEMAVSPGTAYT